MNLIDDQISPILCVIEVQIYMNISNLEKKYEFYDLRVSKSQESNYLSCNK